MRLGLPRQAIERFEAILVRRPGLIAEVEAEAYARGQADARKELLDALWAGGGGLADATRERIEGDAVIEIDDFARPDVDIALTGIADANGRARSDLLSEDIPVVLGAFHAPDAIGSIEGQFYGSDHGEVGGIFERDRLIGAFGASR